MHREGKQYLPKRKNHAHICSGWAEKQTQKLKNIRKNRNVAKQFDTLQHQSLSNVAVKWGQGLVEFV